MGPVPAAESDVALTHIVSEAAQAVSRRAGESPEQRVLRFQNAVAMILAFQPRDLVEAMFASQCVMYHALIVDSAGKALYEETEPANHHAARGLIALGRTFTGILTRLHRYRSRAASGFGNAPDRGTADDRMAAEVVDRTSQPDAQPLNRAARRHAARAQAHEAAQAARDARARQALPGATPAAAGTRSVPIAEARAFATAAHGPSPEALAACLANPEAMAALKAGDPAEFARALGITEPSEAFLAAANEPGSPFDCLAKGPWPAGVTRGGQKT